jgi:hypothetical protein
MRRACRSVFGGAAALLLMAVFAACGARSALLEASGGGGNDPAGPGDASSGPPPIHPEGCADGRREAFRNRGRYPRIAGCAGAFRIPGLNPLPAPSCDRNGGDGAIASGVGCAASDLCAEGWHVCASEEEVASLSIDGCRGASDADPGSFFASQQSGPGCLFCATGTDASCSSNACTPGCAPSDAMTNDVFGCGDVGDVPDASSCGVLNRASNNLCAALPKNAWLCPDIPEGRYQESRNVTKLGSTGGGVLCCADG